MDTRRVIFKNEDGTCSVVAGFYRNGKNIPIEEIILTGSPILRALITVDENGQEQESFVSAFERIGEVALKAAHEYSICEVTDIPASREFREAWIYSNSAVGVDMPKARVIHMNKIRSLRDEKIKQLDIETMKGRDVQVEKQVLRDLPSNIDLSTATTPAELKAIWPVELN